MCATVGNSRGHVGTNFQDIETSLVSVRRSALPKSIVGLGPKFNPQPPKSDGWPVFRKIHRSGYTGMILDKSRKIGSNKSNQINKGYVLSVVGMEYTLPVMIVVAKEGISEVEENAMIFCDSTFPASEMLKAEQGNG